MKTIAQFHIDLTRIIPVESAEGEAIVKFHAAIGHVNAVREAEKRSPKSLPSETSNVVCCGK